MISIVVMIPPADFRQEVDTNRKIDNEKHRKVPKKHPSINS